ncbi:hypothetical protein ACQ7CX_22440 [Chryseobacterium arthrosphaerae]|uniref:hypothetical protein n=1 Tax=Chryseobacterium arthrosphaerae TaxID=651561 RepID=UPI001BAF6BFC|nr:hypothetical protein [Chryseobacterium arthrosphaerae]QUY55074.1 hypothetical protein I2F65_19700 [Chryseobacterium arthrosphaerae]
MNELEFFLQNEVKILKAQREEKKQEKVSENILYELISMKINTELSIIERDFPNVDVTSNYKTCIYVEARIRGYSPEEALEETKRQIENKK